MTIPQKLMTGDSISIESITGKLVGNQLSNNKKKALLALKEIGDNIFQHFGEGNDTEPLVANLIQSVETVKQVDKQLLSKITDTQNDISTNFEKMSKQVGRVTKDVLNQIIDSLAKLGEAIIDYVKNFVDGFRTEGEFENVELTEAPQALVHFRPHFTREEKKWHGEFGFDWMRLGDTKLWNDTNFKNIVGKQYENAVTVKEKSETNPPVTVIEGDLVKDGNVYLGDFKPNVELFKELEKEYKILSFPKFKESQETYYIPWMSIVEVNRDVYKTEYEDLKPSNSSNERAINEGSRAELNLLLEVNSPADYLEFDDNSHFVIKPKKIDISSYQKSSNKIILNQLVTITCRKEFKTNQKIVIRSYKGKKKNLAGQINVVKNSKKFHKQLKLAFIEVVLPSSPEIASPLQPTAIPKAVVVPTPVDMELEVERVKPILRQSYIFCDEDLIKTDIDLSNDNGVRKFFYNDRWNHMYKWQVKELNEKTGLEVEVEKYEFFHDYLAKKVKEIKGLDLSKHVSLFYVNYNTITKGSIGGYALLDNIIIYPDYGPTFVAHEVTHVLGIPHTFTNKEVDKNARFTYQYNLTDNIIDYSHHDNSTGPCCTYHWQWEIMRSKKSDDSVNNTAHEHYYGHIHNAHQCCCYRGPSH